MMRPNQITPTPLRVIFAAVALALLTIGSSALAGTVGPGGSKTVNSGDAPETWTVTGTDPNNDPRPAALTVTQGGAAYNIKGVGATATVTLTGATVTGIGSASGGGIEGALSIGNGATANVTGSTISNDFGHGIRIFTDTASPTPTAAAQVQVTGSTVTGVGSGILAANASTVGISNTTVYGKAGNPIAGPFDGLGVFVQDADVAITDNSYVKGDLNGIGIIADRITTKDQSNVLISGSRVEGVSGAAIRLYGTNATFPLNATILIENNAQLSGGNGNLIEVANFTTADITVDNSRLNGNVVVEAGGVADLTLQNHAVLTGQLTGLNSLAVNSNATWKMVGDGNVANVSMDGGAIDFNSGTGPHRTLTLGTLSGNGTFFMNTDIASQTGDLLKVTGDAIGNHQLNITNTGVEPTTNAGLTVVQTGGGSGQFSLVGGAVDAGVYKYTLSQQGNDWVLNPTTEITPSTDTVVGLFGVTPTVWYGELSLLRTRMGDLRMTDQSNGGAWARTYGKRYRVSQDDGVSYAQNQYGVLGGVDRVVGQWGGGTWLAGIMAGYSESKLDFVGGSTGTVDSYSLGAYATWLSSQGYYFDGVLKYNHFRNDADVVMSNGAPAKGSYNDNGVGASAEFGRHLPFGDRWFVEPSVHLSGLWVKGSDVSLSNGLQANNSHTSSLQAGVSVALGKTFENREGGLIQPYVKASLVQEFVKNNAVRVNNVTLNNDLSGTRVEVGAGVAAQLTKQLQLHAELEYGKGRNIEQPWGFNVGARYVF
ncbi:putative autotransporter [Pandoraea terrae]|uniref:Putative autotransporter n=1 Tax=Pandoraea terrae TaxID=1537710 RepID=A0A5E4Z9T1_9BURK|nr:autotransporter outer membrane beta-barrel domain-containing protein [Pandoraea terrae]VVE57477.1 putative autotransporter [Pandoraea terrae]